MSHVDDGTLHAYLDGELPQAEARGVEAHVAECVSAVSSIGTSGSGQWIW